MLNEAQCERHPAAVAGRARLDAALRRRLNSERAAFWEAVRRCYAGAEPTH